MTTFISAADFGFRANSNESGTTGDDDTAALHDAIAAAMAAGGGTVVLPMGNTATNRYSKISAPIWSGDLPYPLTLISLAGPGTRYTDQGLTLLFTGTGYMFDINTPMGSTSGRGHYVFENLGFRCLNNNSSAIGLNRLATMTGHSTGDRAVIQNVSIKSCGFYGPENYGSVTPTNSPGIFAKITFHLDINRQCEIRGWARGVHLHACDDNHVSGRYFFNGRHIMVEVDQTAGNNNHLDPVFCGTTRGYGEDRAAIWNTANATFVRDFNFEPDEAGQVGIYENAKSGYYERPSTNGYAPLFHIGPDAQYTLINSPGSVRNGPESDWVIDAPADPDYGFNNNNYKVAVYSPDLHGAEIIPPNGRIRVINHPLQRNGVALDYHDSVADGGKARRKYIRIRAENWMGQTEGVVGAPGQCPILTTDAAAGQDSQGRALAVIQLPATPSSSGDYAGAMFARVGTEFAPGDLIRVTVVSRATAPITSGGSSITLYVSPTSGASANLHTSSSSSTVYISTQFTYDVPTDLNTLIQIAIRENGLNAPVNILEILIEVVSPAIATVTSSSSSADIATAINALIAAQQRGVPIA